MAIKSPKLITNNLFNPSGRNITSTPLFTPRIQNLVNNPQIKFPPQSNLSLAPQNVNNASIKPQFSSGGILPSLQGQTLATGQINAPQGLPQEQIQQPEVPNSQLGGLNAFNTQNFQDFIKQYREATTPNEEQKAQIQKTTETIGKLGSLYDQLSALQAPPQILQDVNTQIAAQEKALRDFTEKTRQQTIPQGLIEGQVEQARTLGPIARALNDLLSSRSILGQQREAQQQALQGQIGALGQQFQLQEALQKMITPKEIPAGVLEKFIAPQIPTSVQEFNVAQKNPKFAEFLKTGKRDIEQQQFMNDLKMQQLNIALQNAQTSRERSDITNQINELKLLQLSGQFGEQPLGTIIDTKTGTQKKLPESQSKAVAAGVTMLQPGGVIDQLRNAVNETKTFLGKGVLSLIGGTIGLKSQTQQNFEDVTTNLTSLLALARSGQAVSDPEYKRLRGLIPSSNSLRKYNVQQLDDFEEGLKAEISGFLRIHGATIQGIDLSLAGKVNKGQTSSGNTFQKQ